VSVYPTKEAGHKKCRDIKDDRHLLTSFFMFEKRSKWKQLVAEVIKKNVFLSVKLSIRRCPHAPK